MKPQEDVALDAHESKQAQQYTSRYRDSSGYYRFYLDVGHASEPCRLVPFEIRVVLLQKQIE